MTAISQEARLNHTRFLEHLDWLVKKQIVELAVNKRRLIPMLTEKGKEFSFVFLDYSDDNDRKI